jgi:hypothetical protein
VKEKAKNAATPAGGTGAKMPQPRDHVSAVQAEVARRAPPLLSFEEGLREVAYSCGFQQPGADDVAEASIDRSEGGRSGAPPSSFDGGQSLSFLVVASLPWPARRSRPSAALVSLAPRPGRGSRADQPSSSAAVLLSSFVLHLVLTSPVVCRCSSFSRSPPGFRRSRGAKRPFLEAAGTGA